MINGETKVWYSHKKLDGTGFCSEKNTENYALTVTPSKRDDLTTVSKGMLICNAMNNAVALASSGKISLDQVGLYYQKILSELTKTA